VELKLDAETVERLIREGLPAAMKGGVTVEAVSPGYARIRLPFRDSMLRPGNRISGPTLFAAVDTAMYAAVLAHIGPSMMAVTADMNMHFLRAAAPRDVIAECRVLKLGRRLAVLSVDVGAEGDPPAAHATGTYALP
jgi:uncharacterized protein (TIGR00369 family)